MNILLASRELPGVNEGGGIGVYTLSWAHALQKAGHYVHIVTLDAKGSAPRPNYPFPVDLIEADTRLTPFAAGYSYALYQHLLRLSRDREWDLIEFPDYLGEGYFTIKGKRLYGDFAHTVLRVHAHMSLELCDRLNREIPQKERQDIYRMEQYALRFCDVLSAPSKDLQTCYDHLTGREIVLARHPLPLMADLSQTLQESADITAPNEPMVLYVGRLEYRKGPDLLLKAAIALWEQGRVFGLWLVGQDTVYQGRSFQEQLKALIPEPYYLYVHFMGALNRDQLLWYYAKAAVVVFPSRFENWPNVCLEAMAQGCAIIASQSGGMREMLSGGAGILIDPEDIPGFVTVLQKVLDDSSWTSPLKEKSSDALRHLDAHPPEILEAVMASFQRSAKNPKRIDLTNRPKISVVITEGMGWEQTVESIKESHYPSYEIIRAYPQDFARLDEWWPINQIQGELVLLLRAGERISKTFLFEALTALTLHPAIEAVYPMVQEEADLETWRIPGDATKTRILLPDEILIRPLVRYHALLRFFPRGATIAPGDDTLPWRLVIQMVQGGVYPELLPVFGMSGIKRSANAWIKRVWQDTNYEIVNEGGKQLALWSADFYEEESQDSLSEEARQILDKMRQISRHLPIGVVKAMKRAWKKFFSTSYQDKGKSRLS